MYLIFKLFGKGTKNFIYIVHSTYYIGKLYRQVHRKETKITEIFLTASIRLGTQFY